MARKELYITTSGQNLILCNVGMAVGRGAPNRRDDVFLVQYLLRHIYAKGESFHPPFVKPDKTLIQLDGVFGPQTERWITAFQKRIRDVGKKCTVDGRVDHASPLGISTITHTQYTILWMSVAFAEARPDVEMGFLEQEPDMPPELASALGSVGIYKYAS